MSLSATPRGEVVRAHRDLEPGPLSTLHVSEQVAGGHLLVAGVEAVARHEPTQPVRLGEGPRARNDCGQLLSGIDEMACTRSPTFSSGRFRAMSAWLTMPTRSCPSMTGSLRTPALLMVASASSIESSAPMVTTS